MSKRRLTRNPATDDIVTAERRQHGLVELSPAIIADSAGRPARPYRAVDILTTMERRGSITAAMRQAGEDFRHRFALAPVTRGSGVYFGRAEVRDAFGTHVLTTRAVVLR